MLRAWEPGALAMNAGSCSKHWRSILNPKLKAETLKHHVQILVWAEVPSLTYVGLRFKMLDPTPPNFEPQATLALQLRSVV